MSDISNGEGILVVLAKRFTEERLPKALVLKEKVDRGEVLTDRDMEFLETVLADARKVPLSVRENRGFQEVATRVVKLYCEITAKALENEKNNTRS